MIDAEKYDGNEYEFERSIHISNSTSCYHNKGDLIFMKFQSYFTCICFISTNRLISNFAN